MTLKEDFDKAAENVKNLKQKPTDEELLQIYALFKQATVGDTNTPRPGMFALKEKAKWDSWEAKKGMSKDDAMQAYVDKAKTMVEMYGL